MEGGCPPSMGFFHRGMQRKVLLAESRKEPQDMNKLGIYLITHFLISNGIVIGKRQTSSWNLGRAASEKDFAFYRTFNDLTVMREV